MLRRFDSGHPDEPPKEIAMSRFVLPFLAVSLLLAGVPALAGPAAPTGATDAGAPVMQEIFLSPVYTVDRIYKSMMGPYTTTEIHLGEGEESQLLWIVGYEAIMVGPDGETPMPQEFMCHSNLDIDPGEHNECLGTNNSISGRLFTLSQGQFDIEFPEGFGIPILSREPMNLTTQVLNLNLVGATAKVRHKVIIRYVKNRDLARPMKPLFTKGVYGLALLQGENGYFGMKDTPKEEKHGPGCLMADNAAQHEYTDEEGRTFTGHWVVKPGREVNHTLVTGILGLPYDTTVHYIAVHLHPFAESLELKDLTTGESVFKSNARQIGEGKIGLDEVQYFSSEEGIKLHKSHEYELVSVYNNTTDENQDSMAVMLLYLLDKEAAAARARTVDQERAGTVSGEGVSSSQSVCGTWFFTNQR